jgi:hypothetical protein
MPSIMRRAMQSSRQLRSAVFRARYPQPESCRRTIASDVSRFRSAALLILLIMSRFPTWGVSRSLMLATPALFVGKNLPKP